MAEYLTAAQGHDLVERYGDPLTALVGVSAVGVGGTDTDATVQVFYDTTDLDALEAEVRGLLPQVPIEFVGMSAMQADDDDNDH
jgi:hypothetical protein